MQRGNDCAVREREYPFPIGLDGYLIAQLGAQLFEVACREAAHGDQLPVAVAGWNCDAVDRGGITQSLRPASLAFCAVDFVTYSVQTVIAAQTPKAPRACTVARGVMISSCRRVPTWSGRCAIVTAGKSQRPEATHAT